MGELFGTAIRKGLAWLTGKFIGEVIVSAVATVLLTAVFSGSAFRSDPQAASPAVQVAAPALPALAAAPPLVPPSRFKVSIDNPAFAMAPDSFTFDVPAQPAHRPATKAAVRPVPVPKSRPAAVMAEAAPQPAPVAEQPEVREPIPAADVPVPVHRSFTLFGIGPGSLVPSPRHIMGGVSSVGHSIAGLADWL